MNDNKNLDFDFVDACLKSDCSDTERISELGNLAKKPFTISGFLFGFPSIADIFVFLFFLNGILVHYEIIPDFEVLKNFLAFTGGILFFPRVIAYICRGIWLFYSGFLKAILGISDDN